MKARCPAKVNLLLRVLGRRDDGYHELETVFQAIDLWDELEVRPSPTLTLDCDDPSLPVDGSNLVLRAAAMLAERFPDGERGAALTLRKSIPAQAGLGGGSSDAAAALMLCSRFWELRVADDELCGMAASLGADVPFFLRGGTALGRGRGDRIEPLEGPAGLDLLLGCPPFGIATAEVFGRVRTRLTPPSNGVSLAVSLAHKWWQRNDFASATNDLENIVFEGWPELKRFRDALLEVGARAALLSGSGSTVFGVFDDESAMVAARNRLSTGFGTWRLIATRAVAEGIHLSG